MMKRQHVHVGRPRVDRWTLEDMVAMALQTSPAHFDVHYMMVRAYGRPGE